MEKAKEKACKEPSGELQVSAVGFPKQGHGCHPSSDLRRSPSKKASWCLFLSILCPTFTPLSALVSSLIVAISVARTKTRVRQSEIVA